MRHRIIYSRIAESHLAALTARDQRRVMDAVDVQLQHEPLVETRNRKPMRPNPLAPWELRVGDLRVYYEMLAQPVPPTPELGSVSVGEPLVQILAIGVKHRNRVVIAGEEIDL